MLDKLLVQPDDTTPIYLQIERQLLRFIRAGHIAPGEELPSVRAIAAQLAINPMTVSKTFNRLVDSGWLVRRRGKPTCVADPLPQEKNRADEALAQDIHRLVSHCKQLKITQSALLELIRQRWKEQQ